MDLPRVTPLSRCGWTGRCISVDGTDATDFGDDESAIGEVLASGETGGGWDGTVAAVFRLKDGRFVAYETWWDPSGDGFSQDAYGGDADLFFGATEDAVVWFGLSRDGRHLCGYPETRE